MSCLLVSGIVTFPDQQELRGKDSQKHRKAAEQLRPDVEVHGRSLGVTLFSVPIRLVLDDGTGEAHVWAFGALVRPLLGLNDSQWEGLQRGLRVRGQVEVCPWGQNLVSITSCLNTEHT